MHLLGTSQTSPRGWANQLEMSKLMQHPKASLTVYTVLQIVVKVAEREQAMEPDGGKTRLLSLSDTI